MHDASLDARGYELPYAAVGKIGFEGAHYRRDIAAKGLRG
jgi:phosphoribosylamine-glycine ligase